MAKKRVGARTAKTTVPVPDQDMDGNSWPPEEDEIDVSEVAIRDADASFQKYSNEIKAIP